MSELEQGITEIEVAAKPSQDYQGVETRIRYDFGRKVLSDDVVAVHAKLQEFVTGLAQKQLEHVLARSNAEKDAEVARQSSTTTSDGDTSAGVQWKQASKPKGGTLRYRPTSNLGQEAFKAMITEAIVDEGFDPEDHVIFDERTGKWGLESGNKRYSAATVKPAEDTAAYDELTNDGKTKQSFFVDFEDDGTVSVNPTNLYKDALEAADEDQDDPYPEVEQEDEIPF